MKLLSTILVLSLMLASMNCQDQLSVPLKDITVTSVEVEPDKIDIVNAQPLAAEIIVSTSSEATTPPQQQSETNQIDTSQTSIGSNPSESPPVRAEQAVKTLNQSQNKELNAEASSLLQPQHQQETEQRIIHPDVQTISLDTLTQEQKKKMLEQEAILSAFHNNPDGGLSKYANMSAEQLVQIEKEIQEEARRAYENAMKQMEERDRKAAEELDRMIKEQKLSKTQRISHQENKEFKQRQEQFNPRRFEPGRDAYYRHQFHEYMFELQQGEQDDFSINLPIAQTVALYLYTYTNNNGIYSLAESIEDYLPAEIHIYQNNNRQILSDSFYFKKYLIFEGKQHFTYFIKVSNPGNPRLFALNLVHLLEHTHIAHTFDSEALVSHSTRSIGLQEQLSQKIEETYRGRMMQLNNHKELGKRIRNYYLFNLAEMALVIFACLFQIKYIEKLLNSGSIV